MIRSNPYFPYDDEADEIPDDMDMMSEKRLADRGISEPMDEEEARSYSSMYDIPMSHGYKMNKPKL